MERFSALLALCAGNSPVTGEFPSEGPVTRSFDVLFDLRLNKRVNNVKDGDLRRHHAHYDVIVMNFPSNIRNMMLPIQIFVDKSSKELANFCFINKLITNFDINLCWRYFSFGKHHELCLVSIKGKIINF